MKPRHYIFAGVVTATAAAIGGWWGIARQQTKSSSAAAVIRWQDGAPTSIQNDPVKVFQRAFWASPAADDVILHAERREWSDADGLKKWQWFLVVKPSPALLKRLRDDNAFGLAPATAAGTIVDAPAWFAFPADEVTVLKSPQTKLQLIFHKKDHLLLATDSGAGFRPGAPEPPKPAPQAQPTGRLPAGSPPKP